MATQAQGLHSLATIIKRLEAATSRIEDIVATQGSLAPNAAGPSHAGPGAPGDAPPPPPPPPPPPAQAAPAAQELPKSVAAFDERIIDGKIKPFVELSKGLGSPSVAELAELVQKQYDAVRSFLLAAASCQKPDTATFQNLVAEVGNTIASVQKAKEAHRREAKWFSYLTMIGEGAQGVAWIVSPKPMPEIDGYKDSVVYYQNKVIKESDKDPKHVEWARSYTSIFDALKEYVKEFHTTGVAWNPKGVTYDQFKSQQQSASSSSSGGGAPPPPPPPPPGPPVPPKAPAAAAPAGGVGAVFAEINKGEAITKGLRKVDKSEMTHKNPALRAGSVVPASSSSAASSPVAGKRPTKPTKPTALAGKKPPKFVLEGQKWLVEHQEGETVTVEETSISQSVNIFGCKNTTVVIKGKVNAVTIYNSVKTSVLVESVVASISITSSPSFTIQVTGTAPMIQIDSTDSGQIYLSKDSLNAEITTAKCSAINISLPVEGEEDGVFEEQPVPEMLKTVVKDGKLVTSIVEHTG